MSSPNPNSLKRPGVAFSMSLVIPHESHKLNANALKEYSPRFSLHTAVTVGQIVFFSVIIVEVFPKLPKTLQEFLHRLSTPPPDQGLALRYLAI
jgi:hypothetical protein